MRGTCEHCTKPFVGSSRKRFCDSTCRRRAYDRRKRGDAPKPQAASPAEPPRTEVADALGPELVKLGVADTYEARIALGIARQLDNNTVVGGAYSSLSKELDRRVDALRLKAEKADNPTTVVKTRFTEKRAALTG